MNMPGFTAETSLYQVVGYYSAQYLHATGKGESFDSTRVLPQQQQIRLRFLLPDPGDWRYPHDISAPRRLSIKKYLTALSTAFLKNGHKAYPLSYNWLREQPYIAESGLQTSLR